MSNIYDERPIQDIYVEWANTLDSAGTDSGPARERLMTANSIIKMKSMMSDIIWASERADHVKKFVFYGKEGVMEKIALDTEEFHIMGRSTVEEIMARFDDHNKVRLLHAVLGIASEIGEMMEALYNHFYEGEPLDDENLAEEFGDNQWYVALGAKYLGHLTLNELLAGNKAKLVERYGETWSQNSALNRDTESEMKALSGAMGTTPVTYIEDDSNRVFPNAISGTFTITDGEHSAELTFDATAGDVKRVLASWGIQTERVTRNSVELVPGWKTTFNDMMYDADSPIPLNAWVGGVKWDDTTDPHPLDNRLHPIIETPARPISETGTCPYCFHNWHEGKRCGVLPLGSTEGCECEGKR